MIYLSTDHVVYLVHLVPLLGVVQVLRSTGPTQFACMYVLDHADYTGPTRQHEL